jgi:hypothetical protein
MIDCMVTITCDFCKTGRYEVMNKTPVQSRLQAHTQAGWSRLDVCGEGKDRCPECKAAGVKANVRIHA